MLCVKGDYAHALGQVTAHAHELLSRLNPRPHHLPRMDVVAVAFPPPPRVAKGRSDRGVAHAH